MVRLGRATGEQRYLDLARYFVEERGQQPHYFDVEATERGADPKQFRHRTYEYNQSHLPVREQTKVIGHAVRAMYLYSGMADVATEFGDDSLTDALKEPVERSHHQADVCDGRHRAGGEQRGLYRLSTTCRTRAPTPRPARRSA